MKRRLITHLSLRMMSIVKGEGGVQVLWGIRVNAFVSVYTSKGEYGKVCTDMRCKDVESNNVVYQSRQVPAETRAYPWNLRVLHAVLGWNEYPTRSLPRIRGSKSNRMLVTQSLERERVSERYNTRVFRSFDSQGEKAREGVWTSSIKEAKEGRVFYLLLL
jgi:hypothetical protein